MTAAEHSPTLPLERPFCINGIRGRKMHLLQGRPTVVVCELVDGSIVLLDQHALTQVVRAGWPTEGDVDPYERRLAPVVDIPELLPVPAGTSSRNLQAYAVLGAVAFLLGLAWLLLPGGAA